MTDSPAAMTAEASNDEEQQQLSKPQARRNLAIDCEDGTPVLHAVFSTKCLTALASSPINNGKADSSFIDYETKSERPSSLRIRSLTDDHQIVNPKQYLREKFRTDSPVDVVRESFRFVEADLARARGEQPTQIELDDDVMEVTHSDSVDCDEPQAMLNLDDIHFN